jgi:coenzyme F420-reducing hydrogenase delta subunit
MTTQSDNVSVFPAPDDLRTPDMALRAALADGLDAVMVIGANARGDMCFYSSGNVSNKDALWMAEHAKLHALGVRDEGDE